jgi:hypothetical protein
MNKQDQQEKEARIGVAMPKSMRDQLKILAVKRDKTVQDLAFEAISFMLNEQEAAA